MLPLTENVWSIVADFLWAISNCGYKAKASQAVI